MRVCRRQFLRANGAVLALPFLPSVAGAGAAAAAAAARPEKKLLMMYVPNGLVRRCFFPGESNAELPGFVGGFEADKIKDKKRVKNTPASTRWGSPWRTSTSPAGGATSMKTAATSTPAAPS